MKLVIKSQKAERQPKVHLSPYPAGRNTSPKGRLSLKVRDPSSQKHFMRLIFRPTKIDVHKRLRIFTLDHTKSWKTLIFFNEQ